MRHSVEEAIRLLREKIEPVTAFETTDLVHGTGRVLSEDLYASFSVPSYPKSAMDGYAVISEDLTGASKEAPVTLRVLGQVNAGDPANFEAEHGTAVRIMTGGEVPAGYDAVVRQEDTDYGKDTVEVYTEIAKWRNYCKVGEDLQEGERVVEKNTLLTPAHMSVIASLGIADFRVLKPMKAAILSTGSELLEPGETSPLARTYNSTVYQIQASMEHSGVEVVERSHANDIESEIRGFLEKYLGKVDVILTTGGVSVGEKDLMPAVLENIGAEILFRGVAYRPGTPVTAGYKDGTVILCCSGNPFACIVNFQVFFWPMLAEKMGCEEFTPVQWTATLREGRMKARRLTGYVRALYENGQVSIEEHGHSSSVMSSMVRSNCMIIQPENRALEPGDTVTVQFFR